MNKVITFLIVLYLATFAGGWWLVSGALRATGTAQVTLATAEKTIAEKDAEIATLKSTNKKFSEVQANALFLSLALCPTLEATDKNALCVKNGTEWFAQTIAAGTVIADPEIKGRMQMLIQSLSTKERPTAKQFYELLKPLEARSLKVITEILK